MVPKLSSGGTVDIRFVSMELGTTKWREGTFEILEKDNKVNLCVKFNSGGALKTFQVYLEYAYSSLKCNQITRTVHQGKDRTTCNTETLTFNVFQTTPRRQSAEGREEMMPRKLLSCPGRAASTPTRTGLSENRAEKRKRLLNSESDLTEDYPKENDSSSNNKATSDPSRKFLLSCKEKLKQADENRSSGELHPPGFWTDMPASTAQTSSAKRSLVLPSHSTPFKKVRSSLDYGGWNKQRPSALTQPQSPLQGFSNLGNTCYMNAILQSLFSLPSFSSDMLKQSIPWKKVPINALLRRFAHLMLKKDVSCPETKKDLLRKVKNAISSTAERFSGNMQNDAHEFLSQCLDQLKDDVEKMNKKPGEEADTSRLYTCPVAVNMEFEVQHTITCKCCGEVVTKREQFNDLSIDLPRRKKTLPLRSIQDSLDLFFRMEEIEYSCEKCYGKSATVAHKFSKLPRVLILHLKRYSFNAQLSLNSKLGQQVVIPRYLTLLSHCTELTRPPISLGWTTQPNTALNSIYWLNVFRRTGGKVANSSCSSILLDSDCKEEPIRRVSVNRKRRFSSCLPEEDERSEEASFDGINDDEMLAAVLELSPDDAGLSAPPTLEDEPTSSPDTGFGDSDVHDLAYHTDLLETGKKPADVLDSLDLTMDENKENQTPECLQQQGELDWVQQYNLDQEREEQELQQALAQSLQEHEAQELREDDDLKRATELSLQEFSNSLPEVLCSDEDSGNEDILDMEYSEAEAESLKRNAETGDLANSYRLISVVSHIGSNSSSGHYISDVYDMKKQSWLTYNDLDVSHTQEAAVQRDRDRSGYIFFYMHKDVFEQLSEMERSGSSSGSEAGKNILQPL
uniref:Ubiquitin carboxyl-terminal hydrolase n=1 Tax=Nothobranchius furzeri TaxID=105023 RepID=A0A8C6P166_NOTFU